MIHAVSRAARGAGKHRLMLVAKATSVADADCAPQFTLRVAKPMDISNIKACNESTLPENYEFGIYQAHLQLWPSLAIVAEGKDEKHTFMGYVLGKLENDPVAMFNPFAENTKRGHVTSVAVYPKYRRMGVAQDLMRAMHSQLIKTYGIRSCTLHVRVTNTPALRLYSDILGYRVKARIPNYYLDGEDAYHLIMDELQQQTDSRAPLISHIQPSE